MANRPILLTVAVAIAAVFMAYEAGAGKVCKGPLPAGWTVQEITAPAKGAE